MQPPPSLTPFELVTTPLGFRTLRSRDEGETFHPGLGPMEKPSCCRSEGRGSGARAAAGSRSLRGMGCRPRRCRQRDRGDRCASRVRHASGAAQFRAGSRGCGVCDGERGRAGIRAALPRIAGATPPAAFRRDRRCAMAPAPGDFSRLEITAGAGAPHALLYDPYSPKANPRLWSLDHFRRLRARLGTSQPCTLSSYSRSSAVRVTLLLAGFYVGVGPASGEKDQTTLVATHKELIDTPLDARWPDEYGARRKELR